MPTDAAPGSERQPPSPPGIAEVVLSGPGRPPRWHLLVAVTVALGTHAWLWLWAQRAEQPSSSLAAATARIPIELSLDQHVEPPRPPPPSPPEETPRAHKPAPTAPRKESSEPPPPAQAGAIVAEKPDPSAPVDLTSETVVTGTSNAYAGGVTAPGGTNDVAVQKHEVDPRSAPGAQALGPDLSRSVSLEDQNWYCAWPPEADTEQIDEQTVVIRVVVDAEGAAEAAEVVSDPGHGFGQAAATCARRTRFTPARDREGQPVRARSPLIRVRFTR